MECANDVCHRAVSQPRFCPQCKRAAYCSQQCRLDHWYGGHQLSCGIEKVESEGKFRLEEFRDEEKKTKVLGKGSYGEVRLVMHVPTGQKYAMKVVSGTQINKAQFQRQNSLQVMKREILLHRALDHPHIIKLYGHLEDPENVYLVLEFANRGSLFYEIRRQKRLSEDKARTYFRQTCEAVQYLHENKIIHRDIKPENILLDSSGSLKLCDFGWCAESTEGRTTFCGTLDYMAPEMVMGGGHNYSVDIWALGVLLYELVHGTAPFSARKEAEKCQQILGVAYSLDQSLTAELKELVTGLLKADPEERMQLDAILTHPWLLGNKKEPELVGTTVKNYVKGYGMAEGVVTLVEGEMCVVVYQTPNVTEKLPISRVAKIIKRQQKPQESKEDPPSVSPAVEIEEEALLEKIEQWSKAPSKIPIKRDKFMEVLEESNKKFQASLKELQASPKSSLEKPLSPTVKIDIIAVEELKPPSVPSFELEVPTRNEPVQEVSAENEEEAPREEEKLKDVQTGVFSRRGSPDKPRLWTELQIDTDLDSKPPSPKFAPSAVLSDLEADPSCIPAVSKSNSDISESQDERLTVGYSPMASGRMLDFEYERQMIEEKNRMFYAQTEEKWADRLSDSSVVHAPELRSKAPTVEKSSRALIMEVDRLTSETKRGPSDAEMRMQAIAQTSSLLKQRKIHLKALVKEIETPVSLPKVRRPVHPAEDNRGGFLRWVGSMLGCGDRPK